MSMCNNQMDADEKSIQIRHMMTIFDKAETVVAWIGESTPQNQRAFSLMQTVAKGEESDARALLSSEQSAQLLSIELRRLYSSVWLTRTWVRQEIFAARKLLVVCGASIIDWDGFRTSAVGIKPFLPLLSTNSTTKLPVWHYASQPKRPAPSEPSQS